jgi:YesN/AraC family two-component response regulator
MTYKRPGDEYIAAANQHIKEKRYWLTKLSGNPVKTRFPYDPKKDSAQTEWDRVKFKVEADLSEKMGFACPDYFTRVFKKNHGNHPGKV